jgi:holo-[acyl-carrier protein] synthase
MISGIGIDIVEISRVKDGIEKLGSAFSNKILSNEEIQLIPSNTQTQYEFIAGRWAVKEAIAKALGSGFSSKLPPKDISVVNDTLGCPVVLRAGGMEEKYVIKVSISHEKNYAVAMCTVETKA